MELQINWLGGLVAGLAGFALGGLWYSVLFGRIWQRETGVTMDSPKRWPAWLPMLSSVAISVVAALTLSFLIGPHPGVKVGVISGAIIGFLIVAPMIKMNGLFRQDSAALISIHTLYPALQFVLFGLILGLWS